MEIRLGIAPIAWWNDDLAELSDDVSLDECLRQASEAGYGGMETGRRFPMNAEELGPILNGYDMRICGGWFSGLLLEGDLEAEKDRAAELLELFTTMGAPSFAYGEVSGSIQGERSAPLNSKPKLDENQIKAYGKKLTSFAEWCADQGAPLSYHHHMGAVIETEAELDLFMSNTGEAVPLLFDTGHMAFAGGDVFRVIDKYHARINHVHAKDIRLGVASEIDRSKDSFLDAIIRGVFTVPGNGSLNFGAICKRLADYGYEGWIVVEAEQDPVRYPPFEMAKIGHAALLDAVQNAGYRVVN